jgi:hypothetical protein
MLRLCSKNRHFEKFASRFRSISSLRGKFNELLRRDTYRGETEFSSGDALF